MPDFILDCKERWLIESKDIDTKYEIEYLEYLKALDCCIDLLDLALVLNYYSELLGCYGEWYIKNI